MATKIVIVGGVAAGASAAAKARRVNESAEIIIFEKGLHVSFANCGLPYYLGGEIEERQSLFLQTPDSFWKRFRVRVMVQHEVLSIDRQNKNVEVKDLKTGKIFKENYDKLILSPGAGAIVPPVAGIDSKNIFTLKTVPDSDAIKEFIEKQHPKRAVIVGAGFIGLEAAEVLKRRGLEVTIVEMLPQVLPPLDADMAAFVSEHLKENGIQLVLSDGMKAFHGSPIASEIELSSGRRIPMDLAILSIGVRPELRLAKESGLKIGDAGGIVVNEYQQTSDPSIYAAGDAVEIVQMVTGKKTRIPLAGPANKQGRVAGANVAGGKLTFPGSLGTAIVESMGITAAKTGLSEMEAQKAGIPAYVSLTHSLDHAGYYPGSSLLHIKLIAETQTGRILGSQIVGEHGVDKRIDIIATAISARLKVTDLENLDLAYAPQFSSARDPVIIAGFVASNIARDEMNTISCDSLQTKLKAKENIQLVDVRTKKEFISEHIPGAILIPIDELRERLHELDSQKETVVYCKVGLRGYLAVRILKQNGFKKISNLTGGILTCPEQNKGDQSSVSQTWSKNLKDDVSPSDLKEAIEHKNVMVVDVREQDEYRYEHIPDTENIPLSCLSEKLHLFPKDQEIYVLCQTGVRTKSAVEQLRASGFSSVRAVKGGIEGWRFSGYLLKGGRGPLPVMRQVQIVVGILALVGGVFQKLWWVSVIVGIGLLFAGISGKCGLAVALSYMPWNRATSKTKGDSDSCKPCGS